MQGENSVARTLAHYRTFLQRGSARESFLINLSDQESRILSSEKAPTWQFCESCRQGSVTGAAKPTVWQFVKFETTNIYQGCWWPVRLPHSQMKQERDLFKLCAYQPQDTQLSHTLLSRDSVVFPLFFFPLIFRLSFLPS